MELKEFEVSQVTSKELMHDFVLDYCQRLGWIWVSRFGGMGMVEWNTGMVEYWNSGILKINDD